MNFVIKLLLPFILVFSSCNYLDVVPDNVATLDNAFTMRQTAEKYLFTCYRYLPHTGNLAANPSFTAGDEFWYYYPFLGFNAPGWEIARGNQNVVNPVLNYWDGETQLFQGIRDCNIFLEYIYDVPDINTQEREQWIGEVKFLKAFYHFWLFRLYGPIPIIDENFPISSGFEEIKVNRAPIDKVVDYIVDLIDESIEVLPAVVSDELTDLGRITKAIALSAKALVLTTAASPLFNGNAEYRNFVNQEGENYFNQNNITEKWELAAEACQEAIEFCDSIGFKLYEFTQKGVSQYQLSEETMIQMSLRNSVTERWNSEIIWAHTNSTAVAIQQNATPPLDPNNTVNANTKGNLAPPIKIAEQFYSKNGVPINEDVEYPFEDRFELREADESDKYHLQEGYTTVELHFDREERFYASLGFDGGIWYGQGRLDDNDQWVIQAKSGQKQSKVSSNRYSITGYWPKKLVNYENIIGTGNTYTIQYYPWPMIRLTDLYLMYAESLNEAYGPIAECLHYIDVVRERAGLGGVIESWEKYSKTPDKPNTKEGLRNIIHQERLNEFVFEGSRYWDLRRWKKAHIELNKPITGWDIDQEIAEAYYREKVLFNQTFMMRDYFWPIREHNLIVNKNLDQNPGW